MSVEDIQAIAAIASSLTTNAVLLAWLFREMRQHDKARLRLETFHDREREERIRTPKDISPSP